MPSYPSSHRQGGNVILKVILALILAAIAYGVYRAYAFYQTTVAPVVETVSQVTSAVSQAVNLNPYQLTTDPRVIGDTLQGSFRIAPPDGYVGAFGMTVALLGQKHMDLVALIPQGADPAQIFESGNSEIRFNPGPHTIFIAAKHYRAEPEDMREAIYKIAGADGESGRLAEIFVDAGGKRVAALRGDVENYGTANTVVYTFLDDGRSFFAMGPAGNFDEGALTRALTALTLAHPANALLYEHVKPNAIEPPSSDPCGIPGLENEFDVVVVSVARGSTPLDIAIDQSGEEVRREDIVVGTTDKPIVLVLMGNYPIVWNIGQTPEARIAGVLAQGMHRQAVIGLPLATRLTTYSSADGPNACKYFRIAGDESMDDIAAARRLRELFGRRESQLLTVKAGGHFTVGQVTSEVTYAPDRSLASIALPDDVLPGGDYGLKRLVEAGAIRLARSEEVAGWLQGAAKRTGKPYDTVQRNMDSRLRNIEVYVVLRAFDLPEGLAGADARTFIIPPGAVKPGGPQGHCTFLHIDGFECSGVGCTL